MNIKIITLAELYIFFAKITLNKTKIAIIPIDRKNQKYFPEIKPIFNLFEIINAVNIKEYSGNNTIFFKKNNGISFLIDYYSDSIEL